MGLHGMFSKPRAAATTVLRSVEPLSSTIGEDVAATGNDQHGVQKGDDDDDDDFLMDESNPTSRPKEIMIVDASAVLHALGSVLCELSLSCSLF